MHLRYALRSLGRTPVFTAATILTLALGVGANTGAFSALDALLLKPLPYPAPDRLVALYETTVDRKPRDVAEANLLDWRTQSTLFDAMAVYRPRTFGLTLGDRGPVTVIQTEMVMADFFRVLRVPAALGRTLREEEELGGPGAIVLTDRLQRTFSARVGQTVFLNEEPFTVVGVMPADFEFTIDGVRPDAFIPLDRRLYGGARLGSVRALARLKPGVTLDAARAELESMASVQAALYPRTNGGRSTGLRPLQDVISGSRREPLFLLAGAATLLLVLCCANVAGLMLARWTARSREIAVRIALGSDFLSLAQCFLAESAVLSAAGTACGLAAAMAVLRIVPAFVPGGAVQGPLQLDRDAFAFALALALAVAFLIALGPAFALRRADLSGALKGGGRRWRGVLAAAQVALSVVLLLSAGALLRSFVHLMAVKPGFEAANALRFGIGIPEKRYDTDERVIGFHRNLLDRLRALPGVDSAGAGQYLPLTGDIGIGGSFQITGANTPRPQWPRAWHNVVSPGYFRALGIPLFQGRDFSWLDDHPGGARVAIVNQALVRANFPGRPALGAMLDINYGVAASWQIVGIVGDARQSTLDREAVPQIYLSMTQLPADGARYVVRGRVDPRTVAAAVAQQDPRLERVNVEPLELTVERSVGPRAATLRLVAGFGAIALLLTVTGLYGILTSRAAERSREMAIRMALGATGAQTGGLMVAEALRLAVCGIAAGLVAFCLLYGVSATDPVAMGGVALLVIAVSLAASFAPSRRAARTQPIDLLRDH